MIAAVPMFRFRHLVFMHRVKYFFYEGSVCDSLWQNKWNYVISLNSCSAGVSKHAVLVLVVKRYPPHCWIICFIFHFMIFTVYTGCAVSQFHHHHHVPEGLGVFPVPWSSRWSWSLHLFLGRPMFLRPFGLYCSTCFGSLFVSILCTCCSHFFWYCFISFTMLCAPVFCLIYCKGKKKACTVGVKGI